MKWPDTTAPLHTRGAYMTISEKARTRWVCVPFKWGSILSFSVATPPPSFSAILQCSKNPAHNLCIANAHLCAFLCTKWKTGQGWWVRNSINSHVRIMTYTLTKSSTCVCVISQKCDLHYSCGSQIKYNNLISKLIQNRHNCMCSIRNATLQCLDWMVFLELLVYPQPSSLVSQSEYATPAPAPSRE